MTLVLAGLAGSCLLGFLATFEPLPALVQWGWRATYAVVGLCCAWGAVRLWWRPQANNPRRER